jgi:hypothetical protein
MAKTLVRIVSKHTGEKLLLQAFRGAARGRMAVQAAAELDRTEVREKFSDPAFCRGFLMRPPRDADGRR